MILITVAMRHEAKPVIDALGLKNIKARLPVYKNDDYILVITGVGRENSAMATGWAFGCFDDIVGAVNFGIAGSDGISKGELCLADVVGADTSDYVQISDIADDFGMGFCNVITVDKIQSDTVDASLRTVYDMEAYGFMRAAGTFLTNDKTVVLKLISDNLTDVSMVFANEVTSLVNENIEKIKAFLVKFAKYCREDVILLDFKAQAEEISRHYRLTASQTAILKAQLHMVYVFYGASPDMQALPAVQDKSKAANNRAFDELIYNLKNNINCDEIKKQGKEQVNTNHFSKIYVEDGIDESIVKQISQKLPKARIINVPHYKSVFNRSRQNISRQQSGKSLILARATGTLVYKGSDYCNAFGFDKFYYCSTVMGCLYNCEYCYLQGIYPCANIVAFVNTEDFFRELEEKIADEPALVCCSYDSDITGLDGILGTVKLWLDFARRHPSITLEIRTKCAALKPFEGEPVDNVIIAYTLSPDSACREYETRTPPASMRLKSALRLAEKGWRVRLCVEPVLAPIVADAEYISLADDIINACQLTKFEDIIVGEFRMNKACFAKIAEQRAESKLFHNPYSEETGTYVSYRGANETVNKIADRIKENSDTKVIVFEYKS